MTEAHIFALGLALACLAGVRAYLTVFGVGIAGLLGWVELPTALAVTTSRRTPALPEVPSMADMGLAGFDVSNYFGLVAPRGTPPVVIDRINEVLPKLLAMPDVQARFKTDALEPASLGPAALASFLTQDFGDWQKVVATQGIRLDSV